MTEEPMETFIGIHFSCSKAELAELIICMEPSRIDWVSSDYVEQLLAFLKKTLEENK